MVDTGAHIPTWSGRRAQAALRKVKANGRRRNTPCFICSQPIDYSLLSTDPDGCTVQHKKSRKQYPELTWSPSNWAPAHGSCNYSAGLGDASTAIGVTSQDW